MIDLIKNIDSNNILTVTKIDDNNRDIGLIDNLFLEKLSNKVSVLQDVKLSINNSLNDPSLISDPAALARVQAMMADYSLNISLFEKLAQSGVKAVDTLVKS